MGGNWVAALFDRSLDLLAKIVPGLIISAATVVALKSGAGAACTISGLSGGEWVAVFAAAWFVGFAVQTFGERFKLIRYYPRKITNFSSEQCKATDYDWYRLTAAFRAREDYDRHKDGFNRLSLIKEACGNTYVALILAWLPLAVRLLVSLLWYQAIAILLLLIGLIWLLALAHRKHVSRQYDYMRAVFDMPRPQVVEKSR